MNKQTWRCCIWQTAILIGIMVLCQICFWLMRGEIAVLILATAVSFLIPLLIVLVWLTGLRHVRDFIAQPWVIFAGSAIALAWAILARAQANTLLNEIFEVDAGYFPLTATFLMPVFFLTDIALPLTLLLIVILVLAGGVVVFAVGSGEGWAGAMSLFCAFLLAAVISGLFLGFVSALSRDLKKMTEVVALATDFSFRHRCTAVWDRPAYKVIFLSHGDVLAYDEQMNSYHIRPCFVRVTVG